MIRTAAISTFILCLTVYGSAQTAVLYSVDELDFYELSNFQPYTYSSRNDYWVVVTVENPATNVTREVCVSMKGLRMFAHLEHRYDFDSLGVLSVDSIIFSNIERRFICINEEYLNRYFNFNIYSEKDFKEFEKGTDYQDLIRTAEQRPFQKYIGTNGSEKTMLLTAHLLYKQGIYTTQYAGHGSILYLVNIDQHRRNVEAWRVEHIIARSSRK